MIPTPDLSHLRPADYEHVYEPAGTRVEYSQLLTTDRAVEDTFILLDALEQDADILRAMKAPICVDIGSGSGCVSAFLGSILGASASYICTDINPHAALCTRRTGEQNKVVLCPIVANFADPLLPRLRQKVDILVFNPPYVPTSMNEADFAQYERDIAGSWAGGHDGMQVTNILLDMLDDLLAPAGRFYLVALKQNDIPGIARRLRQEKCMDCEVVLQRRAGREHLHMLCITRLPISQ
ncbi:hypothetical protein AURDEDRAFT_93740 [Auricularia subglabra TFB-10046 SS5]|nr:hypothetical protein AURDEDRAFT_93740 [Auricularia subglabra TFB-10046 SS5]